MTLRDVTPRRLLKVLKLVGREGKRDDKAFAGLGCRGDVNAHLGAQACHQVEADARCALGGATVVAGKALLEHARQVCRAHAAAVVRNGKLDALARQALVQQRTRKHNLCAVLARIFNAVLNELAQNKLEPLLVAGTLRPW